jgi:CheY-like chemotaxis protein
MMILIADDDRVQTHILTARLKERGHKVMVAHDAIQTWVAVNRRMPDALILDIQMPGGTGRAVLMQLKSNPKTNQIPVFVLTGSVDPNDREKFIELGAREFLTKPVDMPTLFASLERLVGAAV